MKKKTTGQHEPNQKPCVRCSGRVTRSLSTFRIRLVAHISTILVIIMFNLVGHIRGVCVFLANISLRASGVLNYNPGTFDNYLHHWVDATAGGRFVPEGITSPVVNTSVLT